MVGSSPRLRQRLASAIIARPALAKLVLDLTPDVPIRFHDALVGSMSIRMRRHRSVWLRGALSRDGMGLKFLRHFSEPGGIVFDIGANIGQITRYVAQELPVERVFAFEPMPDNVVDLCRNVELAPEGARDRITVVPCALSDRAGIVTLQLDDYMSQSAALSVVTGGLAAFGRRRFGLAPRTADVIALTIDQCVSDFGLPKPNVVKIDVEGAEALVLEGGRATFTGQNVPLYIELHGEEPTRDVLAVLDRWGYTAFGAAAVWGAPRRVGPAESEPLEYVIASRDADSLRRLLA